MGHKNDVNYMKTAKGGGPARNRRTKKLHKLEPKPKPKQEPKQEPKKLSEQENPKQYFAFAMQRSGHTAVLNWLCKQNGPAYFFDHCDLNKKPKRFVFVYNSEGKMTVKDKKFNNSTDLVFYAFEDKEIKDVDMDKAFVIVREPLNWLASKWSLLNRQMSRNIFPRKFKEMLKVNIKTWENHLKSGVYTIFFDKWFLDVEYRKKICDDLNLNFTDVGLDDVLQTSSFDQLKYDGSAQKMDVLNRWKIFKDDKRFMSLVTPQMKELYEKKLKKFE